MLSHDVRRRPFHTPDEEDADGGGYPLLPDESPRLGIVAADPEMGRYLGRTAHPLCMAISRAELEQHLTALGLRYGAHDDTSVLLGFETERYRNPEGESRLIIAIRLDEGGEYVSFYAPGVFVPTSEHLDVFLRACMIAQWESKMIQFEYDRESGEVSAIIEFPVEDSTLTERQVRRCVFGLVNLLDEFYTPLARAAEDGVLDFSTSEDLRIENLAQFLAGFPPDVLAEALARADAKMRGEA